MQPSTKLSFVGTYKWDLIHYLASIYGVLGKKVAIVDASCEQELRHTLPNAGMGDVMTWHNADCYMAEAAGEDYDVIMTDYGLMLDSRADLSDSTLMLIVTDLQRQHLDRLTGVLKNLPGEIPTVKIYRALPEGAVNGRYADRHLMLKDQLHIVADYEITLNSRDEQLKLLGQYEGFPHFKGLSPAYMTLLSDIVEETMQLPLKTVRKAVRTAQGGRLCK